MGTTIKALIIGTTGLVGNAFFRESEKSPLFSNLFSITRRELVNKTIDPKAKTLVIKDSTQWPEAIKTLNQKENIDVFFSGLGTKRKDVSSFAEQYKIDHDLNLELAKAAKEAGIRTYVLISSIGANKTSMFPYLKMKGELDDEVIEMKFDRTIIVRPGTLLGEREQSLGFLDGKFRSIAAMARGTMFSKMFVSPIFGDEIAKVVIDFLEKEPKPAGGEPQVTILNSDDLKKALALIQQ